MSGTSFKNFLRLVFARFALGFATQLQAVLMGWQMYELTHDPLKLGFVGLAEALPALALALFAGAFVDRSRPNRVYFCVMVLSLLSLLVAWHAKDEYHLYLAALVTGCMRAFAGPAVQSMVPRVVPRENLAQASAWSTTSTKLASAIGPAAGGLLLGFLGMDAAYGAGAAMLLAGFVGLFFFDYRHPASLSSAHASAESVAERLFSGVRFVAEKRVLLSVMSLDMFAVLFGGVMAILPVYATDILHCGPTGLGFLRAAQAVGALLFSYFLIRYPIRKNAGRILFQVVAGFGLCILVFGFSRNLWLSCFALGVAGALDSVSMVIRGAIVQLLSPDEMRGRIAAVNSIFIGSSNEIGAFESGAAAKLLGTVPSVIFGGAMTLVSVAAIYFLVPELRKVDLDDL